MGEDLGSDVDGEELRGKPKRRLPLLHVNVGLQILQQNGKGGSFRARGRGEGVSPERQILSEF